jgi:hypothetical protein
MDNIEIHVPYWKNTERKILHVDDQPLKTQEHPTLVLINSQRKLEITYPIKEGLETFQNARSRVQHTHVNNRKCFITSGLLYTHICIYKTITRRQCTLWLQKLRKAVLKIHFVNVLTQNFLF